MRGLKNAASLIFKKNDSMAREDGILLRPRNCTSKWFSEWRLYTSTSLGRQMDPHRSINHIAHLFCLLPSLLWWSSSMMSFLCQYNSYKNFGPILTDSISIMMTVVIFTVAQSSDVPMPMSRIRAGVFTVHTSFRGPCHVCPWKRLI